MMNIIFNFAIYVLLRIFSVNFLQIKVQTEEGLKFLQITLQHCRGEGRNHMDYTLVGHLYMHEMMQGWRLLHKLIPIK